MRSTQAEVSFEATAYTVSEGSTVVVTVNLSDALLDTVVIPLVANNHYGATETDYSEVPSSLTFNSGETTKTFEFMATVDDDSPTSTPLEVPPPGNPLPGPEGDEAFSVGRLGVYWVERSGTRSGNDLYMESCAGSYELQVIWDGPVHNRSADEWAAHIGLKSGAGEIVSHSFRESPGTTGYFEMNAMVRIDGPLSFSIQVRGRFGSTWGTWSPTSSFYCFEGDEMVKLSFGKSLPAGVAVGTPNKAEVTITQAPARTRKSRIPKSGRQAKDGSDQPTLNSKAEGAPRINGILELGRTLSADITAITDADGLEEVVFLYQWLADDAEIPAAAQLTYTPSVADAGKAISLRVSFTDDSGNGEQLTSAATGVVAAPPPPNTPAMGSPSIIGAARVGEDLTADTTGISDGDGLTTATFVYQWLADDAEIAGATGSSYTLMDADEGKAVKIRVSFTDDADNGEQLTSAATDTVAGQSSERL